LKDGYNLPLIKLISNRKAERTTALGFLPLGIVAIAFPEMGGLKNVGKFIDVWGIERSS
jgi:hypothetical protein